MYKKILVAVDGSHTSDQALLEAVKMASLTSGTLHAAYVVDRSGLFSYAGYYDPTVLMEALRKDGRTALENAEAVCRQSGVPCETELVETEQLSDDISHTLQRCAERVGAELVVLGTHGRRGVQRLVLGSVAERFVRFSRCPVLLVRGSEPEASAEDAR
ncbi:universal stress protein [Paraburkholderia sp. LEh10]|jgi:nucleotide-binding universal stress UspA family protein|uniref:universal stress protein n=1 Tax=Paraburkholderia sp. LEh10 TaxID=2821353 RepID=UPI001AE89D5C|nr:universal stress protein [Paraburkholderia sp. LEh10]MBP0588623.1 universal stress protein [Paraburkholderia sp. LEh10]